MNKKSIFSEKKTAIVFNNKDLANSSLEKILAKDLDFSQKFTALKNRNEKERLAKLELERERENRYQRLNDLYTGN